MGDRFSPSHPVNGPIFTPNAPILWHSESIETAIFTTAQGYANPSFTFHFHPR